MNAENLDPATQAQTIWSDTLALIKQNSRLTAREQGWLAGVTAEAVVGTTIILDVENAQTLQVLQTELNEPIIGALEIANGGSPMFPAFKVCRPHSLSRRPRRRRRIPVRVPLMRKVPPRSQCNRTKIPAPLGIPRSRPATLAQRRRRNARIPLCTWHDPTSRPRNPTASRSTSRRSNP